MDFYFRNMILGFVTWMSSSVISSQYGSTNSQNLLGISFLGVRMLGEVTDDGRGAGGAGGGCNDAGDRTGDAKETMSGI